MQPATALPEAVCCVRWRVLFLCIGGASEPSGRLRLGLSLKSNMHLQSLVHDRAYKDRSLLLHQPQNCARARYKKQTGTKALRRLQQHAKLRKAGMRAHGGDWNIKRLKLP